MSMTVCNCNLVHMIGVDGGLRHIQSYLVEDLTKKGWRVIVNPKRTYYPEYDQLSPHYIQKKEISNTRKSLNIEAI